MKKAVLLIIAMMAVATVFSCAAVAAKAPDTVPVEGPISDINAILMDIQATVHEILDILSGFGNLESNVTTIITDISEVQADIDAMGADISAMQADISAIKATVEDIGGEAPESVVYTTAEIAMGGSDALVVEIFAPTLEEDVDIPIMLYKKEYVGSDPYYVVLYPFGTPHLNYTHKAYTGVFEETGSYVIRIEVPADVQYEVIPKVTRYDGAYAMAEEYMPGDFKVDFI